MAALKKALESENTQDIKAKTEELKQASYKIAEELYKQQGAASQAASENAGASQEGTSQEESSSKFDKGSAQDVDYEVQDDK